MDWVELLEVVLALRGTGMSVPMALEQHAYFGSGASREVAREWLAQRQVQGDPVAAMRSLATLTHDEGDRFAQETLTICLEYPNGDHRRVLTAASEELARQRATPRPARFRALVALVLLAPALIEAFRFVLAGLER